MSPCSERAVTRVSLNQVGREEPLFAGQPWSSEQPIWNDECVSKLPEGAINFNMGTLVGSYASIARMLDEAATVPGTKGIMLTFDDFLIGMEQFGQRIQPLMKSRREKLAAVA